MHHYVKIDVVNIEENVKTARDRLENQLVGSMNTRRKTPAPVIADVKGRVLIPPSWWVDDEDAADSSMSVAREMRTR
jgi:hypothetical protein